MPYLGTVELKSSDIRRIDITSSTSATHTLTWTAPNEQSLIVTINGVKQQNNYTAVAVVILKKSCYFKQAGGFWWYFYVGIV